MDLDSNDIDVVCTIQYELTIAQGTPLQAAQVLLQQCIEENSAKAEGGGDGEEPPSVHAGNGNGDEPKGGGGGKRPPFVTSVLNTLSNTGEEPPYHAQSALV